MIIILREWLVMVVAVALKCIGPEITDRSNQIRDTS
jgi:hypothetical protein